jgi:hypothetical protein
MFIIDCQVYPFQILVYFGQDKKPLFKELSKRLPKSIVDTLKTFEFKVGKSVMFPTGQTLLWLNEKPNSISGLATLNHEIFHCACFILERVGIVYSESSDEAYAYLIEYLTKQIYNELNITFS